MNFALKKLIPIGEVKPQTTLPQTLTLIQDTQMATVVFLMMTIGAR